MRYELLVGILIAYFATGISLCSLVKIQSRILTWYIPYVLAVLFLVSLCILPKIFDVV